MSGELGIWWRGGHGSLRSDQSCLMYIPEKRKDKRLDKCMIKEECSKTSAGKLLPEGQQLWKFRESSDS